MTRLRAWGLAVLSGVLTFVGFAGFGVWPLAFVAFVPLFVGLDALRVRREGRGVLGTAWLYGFVTSLGGFHWLVPTLETFSGFSTVICALIASVLLAYTALVFVVFGAVFVRLRDRGVPAAVAAPVGLVLGEWLVPQLFPFHYRAALHDVPVFTQIADVGGVLLVSAMIAAVNGALVDFVTARGSFVRRFGLGPRLGVAILAVTLAYGAISLGRNFGPTTPLRVGLVQANMDVFAKRFSVYEGDRRHIEQTLELERTEHPDLVVWPESAFVHVLPSDVESVGDSAFGARIRTPLLFGTLTESLVDGRPRLKNTAVLADAQGRVRGTYDKTFLLAFAEYMPLAAWLPVLEEWSPNTGRFAQGDHVRALEVELRGAPVKLGTIICYEDILPDFVRAMAVESSPQVLMNLTNDAWFGDTHEPWIHLALAKFRAIEHRIPLVRSTNSGVSAFVDAWGRVTSHTRTFVRGNLVDTVDVPVTPPRTLYARLGAWPAYVALAAAFVLGRRRRRVV